MCLCSALFGCREKKNLGEKGGLTRGFIFHSGGRGAQGRDFKSQLTWVFLFFCFSFSQVGDCKAFLWLTLVLCFAWVPGKGEKILEIYVLSVGFLIF